MNIASLLIFLAALSCTSVPSEQSLSKNTDSEFFYTNVNPSEETGDCGGYAFWLQKAEDQFKSGEFAEFEGGCKIRRKKILSIEHSPKTGDLVFTALTDDSDWILEFQGKVFQKKLVGLISLVEKNKDVPRKHSSGRQDSFDLKNSQRFYDLLPSNHVSTNCSACIMIEKMGNKSLEELKKMPEQELTKKDKDGYTPFFWSIYHSSSLVRDFLLAKVAKQDLISDENATELISQCALSTNCSLENMKILLNLGYRIGADALSYTIHSNEGCSLQKFQLLSKFDAPLEKSPKEGFNMLHQIVDRAREGRPKASRKCLVSAIQLVLQKQTELKNEKDNMGRTPIELARYYQKSSQEWGSSIQATDFDPLIKALE